MKSKRLYIFPLLFLLLTGAPYLAAKTNVGASASEPFELGGQILGFLHPNEQRDAGMTWLKMQISYNRGAGGSTADAQNVINHARNHGFKVLLSIVGIKSELAANPTQYYIDYADFLRRVALLNPDAIEVWNEPNIDYEWPLGLISGTSYAAMLARAYPAIKGANANVMVISAAPAPTGYFGGGCSGNGCDDYPFIVQMKNAGAAQYFDCTGIHYNEGVLPPTASSGDPRGNPNHYTRYYPTMVSTYRSVFPTKPLCFTELGYISPDGLGGLPTGLEWGLNTSAQEQAAWLAEAARVSRDSGIVRLMVVWNVDAPFTSGNVFAGWAMIRQNGTCLSCVTLGTVMNRTSPPGVAPERNYYSTGTVNLTWSAVTWAAAYEIQIDNSKNFSAPLEHQRTVAANVLGIITPALSQGMHYWRVRAQYHDGTWGIWGPPESFQIALP